ncbi:hypothetical protein Pyrfu_1694 [Pyrolobus fumarii 1A]|uniref:Acetolactate synthase small subunit n=1 Tax=Pyrolobus fumarii (strain DSM 11204 / 1A) TaxID=694429 RepID=G0ECI0_PYRF1|nr:ACT domain-containing protein [Pyrolobus fumarii]AEM39550.1 hypothetical protein Pyrfu_1694 [Pyrolobus fumarii 1A]
MELARYVLRVSVFGGMDGLMRIVNILRRGKVRYRNLKAEFDGTKVEIRICLEGVNDEVRWIASKLERLPETYVVKVEPTPEELREVEAATTPG